MLTFKDPVAKSPDAFPVSEKIKEMSAKLEKEFSVSPYVKYTVRRKCDDDPEEDDEDEEEDFAWYNCELSNTYFCLTLDNT